MLREESGMDLNRCIKNWNRLHVNETDVDASWETKKRRMMTMGNLNSVTCAWELLSTPAQKGGSTVCCRLEEVTTICRTATATHGTSTVRHTMARPRGDTNKHEYRSRLVVQQTCRTSQKTWREPRVQQHTTCGSGQAFLQLCHADAWHVSPSHQSAHVTQDKPLRSLCEANSK